MILGTASSVGKSTIATAFCRYFKNKGMKVAPFKALNISLNSFVTEDGLEMGRAQVVQAEACEIKPRAWMNPVLLKPSGNMKTQVIVNGKVKCNIDSYKYKDLNKELKEVVKEIYDDVSKDHDLIVLEGSGSCAEINLKESDIANMYMAKASNSPVILVADIDRGGVFASVVGTIALLDNEERDKVKGVIINKFRGSIESFKPAMKQLEEIINIPVLGVMPYYDLDIEDEDSVTERINNKYKTESCLDIVVIRLPYMSNFTDFNALSRLENVNIRYVNNAKDIGNPHLIIIPGSKNTIEDLKFLKKSDIYNEIIKLEKNDTTILGICGGYQILGECIEDSLGIEGEITSEKGFGFLPIKTVFNKEKVTNQSKGRIISKKIEKLYGIEVSGYEIHNGETFIENEDNILIKLEDGKVLGAINDKGNILGTYLHGIFDEGDFLNCFISDLLNKNKMNKINDEIISYKEYKLNELNKLSNLLEENIDMGKVEEILKL